jgi:hypothetical protein
LKKSKSDITNEFSIKNNNKIDLLKTIKSEVNLLELPFFELFTKGLREKTEIEYRAIKNRENQIKEIVWNVSANSKYGYPGPFDREVHKAIEQIISEILREKGKIENPISFSLYDLCKRMGIKGGGNYQQIKKALERIQTTVIKSENAFYHKGNKKWISSVFCLYDAVIFRGEQLEDGSIAEINLLFLSDIYLQSLNSHNTKLINYTYWRSLKSKIASRLYEILGVKFYGIRNKKGCDITYKYSTLCQLLPLTLYRYISDAKRQLNSGNDELKDTGFISKYEWIENGNKDWLISYWPGERAKEEMKRATLFSSNQEEDLLLGPKPEVKKISEEQINLIDKLVKINVSEVTAEKLIKNNDQGLIEKWIKVINYSNADDKAAYIVKAIRENWQFPEEYLRKIREQKQEEEEGKTEYTKMKNKEEEDKKRKDEIKKIGKIFNSLSPLQQEEIRKETEKRLPDFWEEKLNKKKIKGEPSKLLEVVLEEKRREIIKEWIKDKKISF